LFPLDRRLSFSRLPVEPVARARVADAKDALPSRPAGRADPGRIVAELPFGFWERLLTHGPPGKLNYEMALWRPALPRAFPNSRRRRVDVHKPIPTLRDLRNRIAHHEPIFGRPLAAEYQTILEVTDWIRPELVAEAKYLTCPGDNLLRQVVYEGLREDKPATDVRRAVPHPRS
jgi:hypothetical protein